MRKIEFTIKDGVIYDTLRQREVQPASLPTLYVIEEDTVLQMSFQDKNGNPQDLSEYASYKLGIDNNFVHILPDDSADELMVYSEGSDFNVAGDWTNGGDADPALGQITVRVNCFTTGFLDKLNERKDLVAYMMVTGVQPDADESVLANTRVVAHNTVVLDEGVPPSANPGFAPVQSVFGRTGAVVAENDYNADQITETATGKIMTDVERTKLAGIEDNATEDQTGAEIKALYELEANAYTDTKDTKLTGIEDSATADQTGAEIKALYELEANAYTDTKDTKLAGVEDNATADQTGAEIKLAYEAELDTNAFTDAEKTKLAGINGDSLTGAEIKALYEVEPNAYTDTKDTKLAGIEDNATADQTGAEIKAAYEAELDTNAFTDAEQTKLAGIEDGATADQTGAEIKALYEVEANAYTDTKDTKLTGIEESATADQTGAEIKALYEAELDTNAFTDAEQTKLTGIEDSATADQTGAEIKALYELEANAYTDTKDTKLAGIEDGATADQTGAEIKALYELEANAYTDAKDTKLAGIEDGATADQTGAEIKALYEAELDTNAYTDTEKSKVGELVAGTLTAPIEVPTGSTINGENIASTNYVDASVVGYLEDKGNYDAATNTPDLDTTPSGIKKGDVYFVSVAGTFFTEEVEIGDNIRALQDDPTTLAHWAVVQANLTPSTIKTQYESNADTNAFTDAEQTKLTGIEDSATADQTGAEIKALYEVEANAYTDTKDTKLTGIEENAKDDQTLAEVLTTGSVTGGTDITVTHGDDIVGVLDGNGPHGGGINVTGGGSTTGIGGTVFVQGGDGETRGGEGVLAGGDSNNPTGGQGGTLTAQGGNDTDGGHISVTGGISNNGPGGDAYLQGGYGTTAFGNVNIGDSFTNTVEIGSGTNTVNIHGLTYPTADAAAFTPLLTDGAGNLSLSPLTKILSFDFLDARFFGELGLPNTQGWTHVETGSASISVVEETFFGITQNVLKFDDDYTSSIVAAERTLTDTEWQNAYDFGAAFSGIVRLDTADGSGGHFWGMQATPATNPHPTSTGDRRYGFFISNSGGNLNFRAPDTGDPFDVTLDGTGGNPLIAYDEEIKVEIVVPAGLGAADVYVNGFLLAEQLLFTVNNGGKGSYFTITSGSANGTNRVFYVANYGATIYESANTLTMTNEDLETNDTVIVTPPGRRDYTVEYPETGTGQAIGATILFSANNVGGNITVTNENPAAPLLTINGLATFTADIKVAGNVVATNSADGGSAFTILRVDYVGGITNDKDLDLGSGSLLATDATLTSGLKVESEGDAVLELFADTLNGDEDNNPYIHMTQDGGTNESVIGMTGVVDTDPLGNTVTNLGINELVLHASENDILLASEGVGALKVSNADIEAFVPVEVPTGSTINSEAIASTNYVDRYYTARPTLSQLTTGQVFFLDDPIDGVNYLCAFDGTDVHAVEATTLYTPV